MQRTPVEQLAMETRQLGLNVAEYRLSRVVKRIEAELGPPGTRTRTVHDLALTALTLVPRPKWVRDLTGLGP